MPVSGRDHGGEAPLGFLRIAGQKHRLTDIEIPIEGARLSFVVAGSLADQLVQGRGVDRAGEELRQGMRPFIVPVACRQRREAAFRLTAFAGPGLDRKSVG